MYIEAKENNCFLTCKQSILNPLLCEQSQIAW